MATSTPQPTPQPTAHHGARRAPRRRIGRLLGLSLACAAAVLGFSSCSIISDYTNHLLGFAPDPYHLNHSVAAERITAHANTPTAQELLGDTKIAAVAFACPYSDATRFGENIGELGLNNDNESALVTYGADGRFLGVARTGAVGVDVCPVWDKDLAETLFGSQDTTAAPRFDATTPLSFRQDGDSFTLIGVGQQPQRAGHEAPARP